MWFSCWLRNWKRSDPGKRIRTHGSPRQRATCRPRLEALEDRCLPSFTQGFPYPVGTNPQAVVTADVNGDGKLDLITANFGTYNSTTRTVVGGGISVLLCNGNGTFGAAQNYAAGSRPKAVAVGDLNGDGKLDIVTGSGGVLLGNGDGTFRTGPNYSEGGTYLALNDFNGDGKLDLITNYGGTVSVLLGNGDGTFRAGQHYAVIPEAVGDFNGDRKLDVIALDTTSGTLCLLPGNGDGTFGTAQTIVAVGGLRAVTVADFNGDGKLDVAYAYSGGNTGWGPGLSVSEQLGNGDGTFRYGTSSSFQALYPSPGPVGLAAADFNGDGKLDLIAFSPASPGTGISVLPGHGDGGFGPEQDYWTPQRSPTAFAVGDFNGDGFPDLAVVGVARSPSGSYDVSVPLWSSKTKWV